MFWNVDKIETVLHKRGSMRWIKTEAAAVVIWVFAALFLAALLMPFAFRGGQWLVAQAAINDYPRVIESLAKSCENAKPGRYFSRCLAFSILALLPFLIWRIKRLGKNSGKWLDFLAVESAFIKVNPMWQSFVGCLLAAGILWLLGISLAAAGVFHADWPPVDWNELLSNMLITAPILAFIEEFLFRGILLGFWLRSAKPFWACIGSSAVFSFLHFLQPPKGQIIADPSNIFAGFELLGKIFYHFMDPVFFVTDLMTLFAVGLILAWTRVKTGLLWVAIGLHAGWVMAFKSFNQLYQTGETPHFLQPWGVGDNVRSGLLPLLALILTAVCCHFFFKRVLITKLD